MSDDFEPYDDDGEMEDEEDDAVRLAMARSRDNASKTRKMLKLEKQERIR